VIRVASVIGMLGALMFDGDGWARSADVTLSMDSIRVAKVVTLGAPDDSIGFQAVQIAIARDSRGRFYVAPSQRWLIDVFDAQGRYVGELGRPGLGPGEFPWGPSNVAVIDDTIFVLATAQRFISVFDDRHRYVRMFNPRFAKRPWPSPVFNDVRGFNRLSNGDFVLCGLEDMRSPQRSFLCQHLAPDGLIRRYIGPRLRPDPRLHVSDNERALYQIESSPLVATTTRGSVWTYALKEYRLEEWLANGERGRTITRKVDWSVPITLANATEPKRSFPAVIWVDDSARVWTATHVRRSKEATPPAAPSGRLTREGSLSHPGACDELFDTMIEAFDRKGMLLATRQLDGCFLAGYNTGYMYRRRVDKSGIEFVDSVVVSMYADRVASPPR
jgi:hypothetical protein